MDRQAEHLFAERLAEGERPPPQSETGERPLKMERLWIIDGARNPPNAQVQLHPVALHPVGQADGVLRPRGLGLRRDDGGLDRPGKALGVEGGDFPPPGKLSVKDLELFKQDGGLQRIEARIQPQNPVVVLFDSAAVQAQRIKQLGPAGAAGKDRASVSIAAERLGGKEAGGRNLPKGAGGASATGGAEALGRILEQPQPFPPDEGQNPAVIGGQAEKIDRDDPCRAQPALAAGPVQRLLQGGGIKGKAFVHLHKNRGCPPQRHRLGSGGKGKGGQKHRLPRTRPEGKQRQRQRIGSVGAAQREAGARAPGEGVLQRFDLCPADVCPFPQNLSHCGQNSGRKSLILTRKP